MNQVITYCNEALEELRHVRWPTRQQAIRLSVIVLVFTALSSLVFGLIDFGLSELLNLMLRFA